MKRLAYEVVDVFTNKPYGGNPLAICIVPESAEISDQALQLIAREFNLSETVFLYAPNSQDSEISSWRVRIFTTTQELPFAGHPIIGTADHIFRTLNDKKTGHTGSSDGQSTTATIQCEAGDVSIAQDSSHLNTAVIPHNFHHHSLRLNRQAVEALQPGLRDHKDSILGINLLSPVRGMNFLSIELTNLEALSSVNANGIKPSVTLDAQWNEGFVGTAYYVALGERDGVQQYRTRMIESTMEDPATGSMSCGLAMFVALASGQSQKFEFIQAVEMGRESHIGVEVEIQHGQVSNVILKGEAVQVMEGTLSY